MAVALDASDPQTLVDYFVYQDLDSYLIATVESPIDDELVAEHGQTLMMERLVNAGSLCSQETLQSSLLRRLGLTLDRMSVADPSLLFFVQQLSN